MERKRRRSGSQNPWQTSRLQSGAFAETTKNVWGRFDCPHIRIFREPQTSGNNQRLTELTQTLGHIRNNQKHFTNAIVAYAQ